MKLYLDLCVYNRPFDYQGEEKVALEASAFIYILEKVEKGDFSLIVSDALVYENNKNPDERRQSRVASYFDLAQEVIRYEDSDLDRVSFLSGLGFSAIDALHIVLAEKANADYFVTCDYNIVKLFKRHQDCLKIDVRNLIEFVALEEK